MIRVTASISSSRWSSLAWLPEISPVRLSSASTTGLCVTGISPRKTSPVAPSIDNMSPSLTCAPSGVRNSRSCGSTRSASTPTTQVRPMPRATTAACDVLPPRLVSTPLAAIMPRRSSGLVSRRTRMTSSPLPAHATAVAESKAALPTAAPGLAAIPLAISSRSPSLSNCGNISWASCSPVTRRSASSRSIRPSSTSWIPIRNAAAAVRLPTRVCSIQSLPRSTVNSMSHMSL